MARTPSSQPTDRELEILAALWEIGPAPLGEVCDALRRQRPLATTTVATMLKVMLDKRLVSRRRGPRGYLWSARVSRSSAASGLVGRLVDCVFDGSAGRLVAHLMDEGQLSADELAEIRRLLEEKSPQTRKRKNLTQRRRGAKATRTKRQNTNPKQ